MPLNPVTLEAAAATAVFTQLKLEFEGDIPLTLDPLQKVQIEQGWTRISGAVAKAMPEIITHFLTNAVIEITVPPSTFLIAAQAGVPNPTPVPVLGIIKA